MNLKDVALTKPFNKYFDHTLLKPEATDADFEAFLDDAVKYDFKSVCVAPYIAGPIVAAMKPYPSINIGTVVGFPHGNLPLQFKLDQVSYFVDKGVHEIDFVCHYGEIKNENYDNLLKELNKIGLLCKDRGVISKCIVETCYLTRLEKENVFGLIRDYTCINFIKTSTGYGSASADISDVRLWKELKGLQARPLIKAAGGIRDLNTALGMISAGADRLGTSHSVKIMEEYNALFPTFPEGEEKS